MRIANYARCRSVSRLHTGLEDHHGAGTKTVSMFAKLLSGSSRLMMEGVKNLVPRKHDLPLTKVSSFPSLSQRRVALFVRRKTYVRGLESASWPGLRTRRCEWTERVVSLESPQRIPLELDRNL